MKRKKTDKKKFITLLKQFGVGYEVIFDNDEKFGKYLGHLGCDIECLTGMKKVDGYGGFVTIFKFDRSGNFIEMGAFE